MLRWNWTEMPSCYLSKGFPPPTTSRHESDKTSELWVTQKKTSIFLHREAWSKTEKLPLQAVFTAGISNRGKAARDNSCSTWQSKMTLKVTLFCPLETSQPLQRPSLTGKRVPRSWTMQADRPICTGTKNSHHSASQREMLVVKAMVQDTVERLCQPRTETTVSKTYSRFCHRIVFPLQALTYKAHGTEASITPCLSLPSPRIFFLMGWNGEDNGSIDLSSIFLHQPSPLRGTQPVAPDLE